MRRWAIVLIAVFLMSCALAQGEKRVGEIKGDKVCLEFKEEIGWQQISQKLGEPDQYPLPEPGSLGKNTRVYEDCTVIFYVETRSLKEGGKPRPQEVVYKIEICKKK